MSSLSLVYTCLQSGELSPKQRSSSVSINNTCSGQRGHLISSGQLMDSDHLINSGQLIDNDHLINSGQLIDSVLLINSDHLINKGQMIKSGHLVNSGHLIAIMVS